MGRLGQGDGPRAVAVATLFFFGCATTREPLPPPPAAPPVERVYFADPEMELWVEGASQVDPAESQRAQEQSRAALRAALDGRGVPAAEAEAVLVLREHAVARTAERKRDQGLATAGIVVGIVAIVAVVVVAVVASRGKGGGPSGSSGASGPASAPAPSPSPPRGSVAPPAPVAAGVGAAAPQAAGAAAAADAGHPTLPAPPPGTIVARPVPVPVLPPPPPTSVDVFLDIWVPPQPYPSDYTPPPPPPFSVKDRGFFDPDEVLVEMELREAKTGTILWGAAVRGWADPRDRTEVAKLLEKAIGGQPWARRGMARPVPPSPPAAPPAPSPSG